MVIFQQRSMFSHINEKLSPKPFDWSIWIYAYLENLPKYVTRFSLTSKIGRELFKIGVKFLLCLLWLWT